jgi:hypothetical protein
MWTALPPSLRRPSHVQALSFRNLDCVPQSVVPVSLTIGDTVIGTADSRVNPTWILDSPLSDTLHSPLHIHLQDSDTLLHLDISLESMHKIQHDRVSHTHNPYKPTSYSQYRSYTLRNYR